MNILKAIIDWFTGDSDIKEPPTPVAPVRKGKVRPDYDTTIVRNDYELSWADLEFELGKQIEFIQISRLRNNKRSFKYKIFTEQIPNENS